MTQLNSKNGKNFPRHDVAESDATLSIDLKFKMRIFDVAAVAVAAVAVAFCLKMTLQQFQTIAALDKFNSFS